MESAKALMAITVALIVSFTWPMIAIWGIGSFIAIDILWVYGTTIHARIALVIIWLFVSAISASFLTAIAIEIIVEEEE